MTIKKVFIAYSSELPMVGQSIETAVAHVRRTNQSLSIATWRQLDIAGRFIVEGVQRKIMEADIVVADITTLNFNVTYEFGYALGRGRQPVPVIHLGYHADETKMVLNRLGIFDSVGIEYYQNADELSQIIARVAEKQSQEYREHEINHQAPLYLLDTRHKMDGILRLTARIKKARIRFRSFDPAEESRLSSYHALSEVHQSVAVVICFLGDHAVDHYLNNLRGAFLAGLAQSLNRETLLLQEGDGPVPADYREFVKAYKNPEEIDRYFNDFAPLVTQGLQERRGTASGPDGGLLASVDLGAPAAENEIFELSAYYVPTDEFNKVLRGMTRLVVGRKGSGKTALFFQARDRLRRNRSNVVLDLKPEGFQLKRFKEILELFTESVQEHIAVAFWEYVLLQELTYKLLRDDQNRHIRDHNLLEPYRELSNAFGGEAAIAEAGESDFSQRMLSLTREIDGRLRDTITPGADGLVYLESPKVMELIYGEQIPLLREQVIAYLRHKEAVWILFDNIDKGWPTRGIAAADILILRTLIDATRKMERAFSSKSLHDVHTVVFVRNDVYELLVEDSPDRGKERRVSLDWTDRDLLTELLRRRLVRSEAFRKDEPFEAVWHRLALSHLDGESSAEYLIERSLLRPRNVINLVSQCIGNAVNLRHLRVERSDIQKACKTYSTDLAKDLSMELRDVLPIAEDAIYAFIGCSSRISLKEIRGRIDSYIPLDEDGTNRLIEVLLWFAFIGVVHGSPLKVSFIYDVLYEIKKLKFFARGLKDDEHEFDIHPAFWPFLEIAQPDGY